MNEADRSELTQLQVQLRALEYEVKSTATQLEQLRDRIDRFTRQKESASRWGAPEVEKPDCTPLIASVAIQTLSAPLPFQETPLAQPPSIPPVIPLIIAPVTAPRAARPAPLMLRCPDCYQAVLVNDPTSKSPVNCSYCGQAITVMQTGTVVEWVLEKPTVNVPEIIPNQTVH